MTIGRVLRSGLVVLAVLPISAFAAEPPSCDRACLASVADGVLVSIVAHDAATLPLADDYLATENLVPSVPAMMSVWRTVTAVGERRYTIDPVSQQLFFAAGVAEGASGALLYGRIALRDRRIAELELYINRSRGQSGFMFDADGLAGLPAAWAQPVATQRRPSRAELAAAGQSMFDASRASPPAAPSCIVVETGRVAHLSAVMQSTVTGDTHSAAPPLRAGAKTAAVACDAVAHRPTDPDARATIIDEEQSEVVGLAIVRGTVSAYLMGERPESNFLPDGYYARYQPLRDAQRAKLDPAVPVLRATPSAAAVAQIFRIADGRIQGFQRFIQVAPEGAVSPWRAWP